MLKKLLKYEFRATYKEIGIIFLIFAGIIVLSLFSLLVTNYYPNELNILMYLNLFSVLSIIVLLIIATTVILMIRTIWTGLFGKSAYLLFSIPATTKQVILSKVLIYLFWVIIQFLLIVIFAFLYVLVLITKMGNYEELISLLTTVIPQISTTNLLYLINSIINSFSLVMLYLGVSVFVHTYYKGPKKLLLAIAIIMGYSFIYSMVFPSTDSLSLFFGDTGTNYFLIKFIAQIVIEVGIIIGSFFFSSHALDKKLNL